MGVGARGAVRDTQCDTKKGWQGGKERESGGLRGSTAALIELTALSVTAAALTARRAAAAHEQH